MLFLYLEVGSLSRPATRASRGAKAESMDSFRSRRLKRQFESIWAVFEVKGS